MPSLVPIDAAVLDQMAAADARGQAGLTPRAFAQFTRALTRTTWGQAHLRPVALVDEAAQLLASALLYRLPAVVDGHPLTICTVGDVIAYGDTAAHAASLIARVTEEVATWCPGASIIATIAAEGAAVPDVLGAPIVPDPGTVPPAATDWGEPPVGGIGLGAAACWEPPVCGPPATCWPGCGGPEGFCPPAGALPCGMPGVPAWVALP